MNDLLAQVHLGYMSMDKYPLVQAHLGYLAEYVLDVIQVGKRHIVRPTADHQFVLSEEERIRREEEEIVILTIILTK